MYILISNDDGYLAPGLQCLAQTLKQIADVTVVAPLVDRSGASNSLTLRSPIRAHTVEPDLIAVDGTPTDCVHLAITGLLEREPDMVVSGINAGANMGDDILYSGTVAAAMEGRFLGFPAIAVSLVCDETPQHFQTAANFVKQLILNLDTFQPLKGDTILNVNVPDIAENEVNKAVITRLGNRHKSEPVIRMLDPRDKPIYWIGRAGPEQDAGLGTDFYAVRNHNISVTPIHTDLTQYKMLDSMSAWVDEIKLK